MTPATTRAPPNRAFIPIFSPKKIKAKIGLKIGSTTG